MTTLPPELVLACLAHLDPRDPATIPTLLAVSLCSHTLRDLSQSATLWRPLVNLHYSRRGSPPLDRPYATFRARSVKDSEAKRLVHRLQRPLGRLSVMRQLRTRLGSDVVAVLSDGEWRRPSREPEEYLSLAYWATEARNAILRDEAIETWNDIAQRCESGRERDDDFERGVNAFGAFRGFDPEALEPRWYDLEKHPELVRLTRATPDQPRERLEWVANQVCDYLASRGIVPAASGTFHDLGNHYVETAFDRASGPASENRGTLPMTLVSIFCSFVRRLPTCRDIEVRPIGFPGTMLAGLRVRGLEGKDGEWVFVNPFAAQRGRLPTRSVLRATLAGMNLADDPSYLRPATAKEMCLRVGRNLLTSIHTRQLHSQATGIACLYSLAHSLFAFYNPLRLGHEQGRADAAEEGLPNYVEWLTSIVQAEYPQDVDFILDRIVPALESSLNDSALHVQPERLDSVRALAAAIEDEDVKGVEKKWVGATIKWKIGHVFRHRLFGYHAVVRGYDYTCEASENWIMQMQVDRLPFGRDQPFYHVIVANGSNRYVAQENITFDPVNDDVIDRLLADPTIGKYFRKIEGRRRTGLEGEGEEEGHGRLRFVKSLETEHEYPDS
ncbi:hypothetical protein JCM11491_001449 [Sporobolomyces phaffii]